MIGLLQRVTRAEVRVAGRVTGVISRGVLVFVGVEHTDTEAQAERLGERLLAYRVFPDEHGKMNLSVSDLDGGVLLVPQFTLAADTRQGARASFTPAAEPGRGRALFEHLVGVVRARHGRVETGEFGADMQVTLTNDGPVTFWLRAAAGGAPGLA
jgi:D-tyrosyl-tRNA(Tyr) deacylase